MDHRSACIEAINDFRRNHGLLPIAVCSRISDYEVLGTKLRLRSAVAIQPLTSIRIHEYLKRGDEPLRRLQAALEEDPSLIELLDTPLMLWVATVAYRNAPVEYAREDSIQLERRKMLVASFVDTMFQRRSTDSRYTRRQAVHWLSELAGAVTRNNETVFYLENLRPQWLATRIQRLVARAGTIVATGLAGGPGLGLIHGLITSSIITLLMLRHASLTWLSSLLGMTARFGLNWGFTNWLTVALCFGLVGAFLELRPTETIRISLKGLSSRLGRALRTGMLMGLTVWLGFCPLALSASGRAYDAMRQSGSLQIWLDLGFPSALLENSGTRSLLFVLGFGMIVGPIAGLITGLVALLSGEAVQARTSPNQGTVRSTKTAITAVLILGVGCGLVGMLSSGLSLQSDASKARFITGTLYGLTFGLIVGMMAGGLFSLRHYVLRLTLWMNGLAPIDYVRFLDYAVERFFLHKVGGGYIFVHRVIMDYFVTLKE